MDQSTGGRCEGTTYSIFRSSVKAERRLVQTTGMRAVSEPSKSSSMTYGVQRGGDDDDQHVWLKAGESGAAEGGIDEGRGAGESFRNSIPLARPLQQLPLATVVRMDGGWQVQRLPPAPPKSSRARLSPRSPTPFWLASVGGRKWNETYLRVPLDAAERGQEHGAELADRSPSPVLTKTEHERRRRRRRRRWSGCRGQG